MQLGLVGLGRMGANMVRRLQKGGHSCVVFDLHPENVQKLVAERFHRCNFFRRLGFETRQALRDLDHGSCR